MASKKHTKPTYVPKAEREAQKKREAKKNKPPMPKARRLALIIGGSALALALILLAIFYHGDNLRVKNGEVVLGGDNWIVSNLSTSGAKRYYKLGESNALPGYVWDEENNIKSDKNERAYWYVAEEENSPMPHYYVSGVAQPTKAFVEETQSRFVGMYGEESVSAVREIIVDGRTGWYFVTLSVNEAVTPEKTTQEITCYFPTIRNSSILISASLLVTDELPERDQATIEELLGTLAGTIVFEEK